MCKQPHALHTHEHSHLCTHVHACRCIPATARAHSCACTQYSTHTHAHSGFPAPHRQAQASLPREAALRGPQSGLAAQARTLRPSPPARTVRRRAASTSIMPRSRLWQSGGMKCGMWNTPRFTFSSSCRRLSSSKGSAPCRQGTSSPRGGRLGAGQRQGGRTWTGRAHHQEREQDHPAAPHIRLAPVVLLALRRAVWLASVWSGNEGARQRVSGPPRRG